MSMASDVSLLVVEDDDFQRRTLVRMLRGLGAREITEAADGREALEIADSGGRFNVAVCDLNMPGMDGMELIRHFGATQPSLSLIIASAESRALLNSVEKMTAAYGVRLLGVIEKPVTRDTLATVLSRHKLQGPRPSRPQAGAPKFSLDEIRAAIGERQFEPFFQPKVELATGKVVGAEALARWRSPAHGIIGPHAFIPPLEESRQIDDLTFLMLEKAAHECCIWRDSGLDITVSVNLSLVSLTDTSLAERITHVVRGTGLEPRHMTLEITETAAMTEVAPALENLVRLRMRGFGLSVDDYGTGFSSLRQLTRVPFTELKIDQGFVNGCGTDPAYRAIVESSVEMARRLKIKSVGEGVEAPADWDGLKGSGCDVAQGYYIAKPVEAPLFSEFCRGWTGGR